MYCSKCGEADQNANSYCRKCGNFVNTQKPISVSLTMNIISFVVSFFLLLFLMGYGMGAELATGKSSPNIIYLVYVFLGVIAIWQLINVIFSASLMSKMSRTSNESHVASEKKSSDLVNSEADNFLPPADLQSFIPSIVEDTTKNLVKIERN